MTRKELLAALVAALLWTVTDRFVLDMSWVASITTGVIIVFVWWAVCELKKKS